MRIGIDCRLWLETGVGRYIRNLILNIQKLDKENEYVLFMRTDDTNKFKPQASSFQFRIVKADIRWHTIEEQLKLPQILNKENLDLMHFPYQSIPIFYNKPFILTIHDLIPYNFPTGQASALPGPIYNLKLLAYKFVIGQAARKAKKIIAVSNATKDEIIDHLGVHSSKVTVICEGASVFSSKATPTKRYTLNAIRYFLYVGNAYPHKNLERLLEAFSVFCHSGLVSESHDIKLILVVKDDYFYKRLKKKVEEENLSDKIIFKLNVADEELSNLYQNALALVLPSLMEGFGLPALEAMANKCLVLASDIPSLREVCGDAAIYFDPYNIKDIAKKMNEVDSIDSSHYSDKKEKGLVRANFFSWEKMAKETLSLYESCVGV